MSAQVKKAGRIGMKIVAGFLFLFLVMLNINIGIFELAGDQWTFHCDDFPGCGGPVSCYQGNYLDRCTVWCAYDDEPVKFCLIVLE